MAAANDPEISINCLVSNKQRRHSQHANPSRPTHDTNPVLLFYQLFEEKASESLQLYRFKQAYDDCNQIGTEISKVNLARTLIKHAQSIVSLQILSPVIKEFAYRVSPHPLFKSQGT